MSQLPQDFLSVLNARSQDIFRRIVERYLDTGAPVGSRDLSRMLQGGLSPASVRNVMADRGAAYLGGPGPDPGGFAVFRRCHARSGRGQ